MSDSEVTIEQEIADVFMVKPHVLLLGAGASKAALPNGDKNGRPVPLLRDVAENLQLVEYFPDNLKPLATDDFEAAYSRLFDLGSSPEIDEIDAKVRAYFADLELPDEPNLYDVINLSLREKDVIATFNWDPFLIQSGIRLTQRGITSKLPRYHFLHGNVLAGFCEKDSISGLPLGTCSKCKRLFKASRLLYPVEHKDYQSDAFIRREWEATRHYLKECLMFTVFGYSAPSTDKEAVDLLKDAWGAIEEREMEQTEVINRPGADHNQLRQTWYPFIHTHHYDIHENFYDSFVAKHPRRSIEAYFRQYWEAKFITDNPVPQTFATFEEMAEWFRPLLEAEERNAE